MHASNEKYNNDNQAKKKSLRQEPFKHLHNAEEKNKQANLWFKGCLNKFQKLFFFLLHLKRSFGGINAKTSATKEKNRMLPVYTCQSNVLEIVCWQNNRH